MINLSDNILEAVQQIEEAKSLTRAPNNDIPNGTGLTGRQAYLQFCYRMAKFDDEFATPDDVIAQSWLNTGLTRMCHEFEKRLFADGNDLGCRTIFDKHISTSYLERDTLDTIEDSFLYSTIVSTAKFLTEPPVVYMNLESERKLLISDYPTAPVLWWPMEKHEEKDGSYIYWDFVPIRVDAIEVDASDKRRISFLVTNSFSSVQDGMNSKVYYHREPGGKSIRIWFDNFKKNYQIPKGAVPSQLFPIKLNPLISSVSMECLDIKGFFQENFIDTTSNSILNLPIEFHNDLIDYAIDAYFESMFFHNFGKYNMKQARQDADGQGQGGANGMPPMNNMAGRTLAVPPNRYRMGQ